MAFPYIFHENFESGTRGGFDSESDSDGVLDFPHYSTLARFPWSNSTPYSGAYCMRIKPVGGTANSTLAEADINVASGITNYFRFDLYFGNDFAATADDTFALLELLGTGPATVVSLGCTITASTGEIVMAAGSATTGATPSTDGSLIIQRNTWYTIEMKVLIHLTNAGTVDVFITKAGDVAQTTADIALSSQDHIAVEDGLFGLQDHLATTTGTILLDNFIQDDGRLYPQSRYEFHPIITKSGHAFVGPGHIDIAGLLTNEANNVMRLWDTDIADTNAAQSFVVELDIDGNFTSLTGPIAFQNGCYVELSGTDPRGEVILTQTSDRPGVVGPLSHSNAGIRRLGLQA